MDRFHVGDLELTTYPDDVPAGNAGLLVVATTALKHIALLTLISDVIFMKSKDVSIYQWGLSVINCQHTASRTRSSAVLQAGSGTNAGQDLRTVTQVESHTVPHSLRMTR